jgi:hypothetical protein
MAAEGEVNVAKLIGHLWVGRWGIEIGIFTL